MEGEQLNIFDNTPDSTGFFKKQITNMVRKRRHSNSLSYNQTRTQSKSMRSSFPDDFMNDIIVIPKLSTRRLSE